MTALIKQINPTVKTKIAILPDIRRTFCLSIYKIIFVKLIKLVIISIRIYKEYYKGN